MEKDNDLLVLLLLVATPIVIFIAVRLIISIVRFKNEGAYINMEMRRSYEDKEYAFWQKELRCHYLRLIPFVTKRNVKSVYARLFKNSSSKRSDGLFHMLAPSFLGIIISVVCLCSATLAWFTSSNTSNVSSITAATYTLSVEIEDEDGKVEVTETEAGAFTADLKSGSYTVRLTAGGTADTGFAVITLGEEKMYTSQIEPEKALTFTVSVKDELSLKAEAHWGTCALKEFAKLKNNAEFPVANTDTKESTEEPTEKTTEETTEEATEETIEDVSEIPTEISTEVPTAEQTEPPTEAQAEAKDTNENNQQ